MQVTNMYYCPELWGKELNIPDASLEKWVVLWETDYMAEEDVHAIITVQGHYKVDQAVWHTFGVSVDGQPMGSLRGPSNAYYDQYVRRNMTGMPWFNWVNGYYSANIPIMPGADTWPGFQHTVHVRLERGRHKLGLGLYAYETSKKRVNGDCLSATFITV